jgi:5S rRNA maturation endonuclease (ribonuclease M5)
MHIKHIKTGTSGQQAINYLMGEKDHRGEKRESIVVMKGDPMSTAQVIDSLEGRTSTYSSAVIAWGPEEAPTAEERQAVLEDYCKAARRGLAEERVSIAAVAHEEANGAWHIHVVTAKVDLKTGKAFNPAPPGWQHTFDPLRNAWNYERGWARPDDPERARLVQEGHGAYITADAIKDAMLNKATPEHIKKVITNMLVQEMTPMDSRSSLVKKLEAMGFKVPRQGENYITLQYREHKIRLKGELYERNFKAHELKATGPNNDIASQAERSRGGEIDREKARVFRADFNNRVEAASRDSEKRYGNRTEKATLGKAKSVVNSADGDLVNKQLSVVADSVSRERNNSSADTNNEAVGHVATATEGLTHGKVQGPVVHSSKEAESEGAHAKRANGREASKLKWKADWQATLARHKQESAEVFNAFMLAKRQRQGTKAELALRYLQAKATLQNKQKLERDAHFTKASQQTKNNIFDPCKYKASGNIIRGADGQTICKVSCGSVFITKTDPASLLVSMRLFQQLNGKAVQLKGPIAFKEKCIRVMLENNIPLKNTDRKTLKLYGAMTAMLKQEKEDANRNAGNATAVNGTLGKREESNATANIEASRTNAVIDRKIRSFGESTEERIMKNDKELESFKTKIPLDAFLESYGWEAKASKNSATVELKKGKNTILVSKNEGSGHYIYFERHGTTSGTIVDYMQKYEGISNLGEIRKKLRPAIGIAPNLQARARKLQSTSLPEAQINAAWEAMPAYTGNYLSKKRGLTKETLSKFDVRQNASGKACFRHRHTGNTENTYGWEEKGEGWKSFSTGGKKALFYEEVGTGPTKIIIGEATVDLMSYEQLHGSELGGRRIYMGTSGSISKEQHGAIKAAMASSGNTPVILVLDNDEKGIEMAAAIKEYIPRAEMHLATKGKDWNEELLKTLEEKEKTLAQHRAKEHEMEM